MMFERLRHSSDSRAVLSTGLVGAVLLWASWPALAAMAGRWSNDPRYSHGFLVPIFALYLLWERRGLLATGANRPSWWCLPLFVAGAVVKIGGGKFFYEWFDGLSILFSLAGLAALAGGRPALRWAWPAVAFLIFMIPQPNRAEQAMGAPLQRIATLASTYALQTFGLSAVSEGNIIYTNQGVIGVAEACNGLGMLYMFLAFSVGAALIIQRPILDRVLIFLSAAPIALAANMARIMLTGLLIETLGKGVANAFYHDLAGWLMMPLAVAALMTELSLLSRLLVPVDRPDPRSFLPGSYGLPPGMGAR
ncbi:MAG TPA: exosortase/archaeosortase family protein [Isosphaeraceae bacterium]